MGWLSRLGWLPPEEGEEPEAGPLARVETELRGRGVAEAEELAAFAFLLVRVSQADGAISSEEESAWGRILRDELSLSAEDADLVARLVREGARHYDEIGWNEVTRVVRRDVPMERREALVASLYAVAAADEIVRYVEDREIARIGEALLIPRARVVEIRSRHRDLLEELQRIQKLR